jgi:hypothetical protein
MITKNRVAERGPRPSQTREARRDGRLSKLLLERDRIYEWPLVRRARWQAATCDDNGDDRQRLPAPTGVLGRDAVGGGAGCSLILPEAKQGQCAFRLLPRALTVRKRLRGICQAKPFGSVRLLRGLEQKNGLVICPETVSLLDELLAGHHVARDVGAAGCSNQRRGLVVDVRMHGFALKRDAACIEPAVSEQDPAGSAPEARGHFPRPSLRVTCEHLDGLGAAIAQDLGESGGCLVVRDSKLVEVPLVVVAQACRDNEHWPPLAAAGYKTLDNGGRDPFHPVREFIRQRIERR